MDFNDHHKDISDNYLGVLIQNALHDAKDEQQVLSAFGHGNNFSQTIKTVQNIEIENSPMVADNYIVTDDLFTCLPGVQSQHHATNFSRLMDKWDHDTRPSLPGTAYGWLHTLGLDETRDPYQSQLNNAALLLATRAEMVKGEAVTDSSHQESEPDYHSRIHFLHVLQATGFQLQKNEQMAKTNPASTIPLTDKEKTLMLIAAIAHDLDHPGHGNRECEIEETKILYDNEDQSFAIADQILEGYGLSEEDRATIKIMLRTTDPNGPHKFLKDCAAAHRAGQSPLVMSDIAPGEEVKYKDLEPILHDSKLCLMCAMLSDADLFASAGAGLHANEVNSVKLTGELQACGIQADFTTAQARDGFCTFVVGKEGFCGPAGREAFNGMFEYMVADTKACIEKQNNQKSGPARP